MEAFLALVGALATGITWFVQKKKQQPLQEQLDAERVAYAELLDKYARAIGQVKTLKKVIIKLRQEAYERMDGEDLIAAWNRGLFDDDDSDPEAN